MKVERTIFTTFRVSENERLLLEMIAGQERRTISEMMRELIREGARARNIKIPVITRSDA